jgi:hypothetical protein
MALVGQFCHVKKMKLARLRGQAMVEYSIINWLLVVGLVLTSTVRMIPGPATSMGNTPVPMSLMDLLLYAFQLNYDTYMYSLSLAALP